ncbi:hypothetical protein [Desertibaculum subflavum]|uniref:hypothetical protein n=1 Tax=Desertibaculum subflavum TaxID=2268458 RepID=UPI0013C486BF
MEHLNGGRWRRATRQFLRSLLDQMGINSTELLHNDRHVRRLADHFAPIAALD